MAVVDRLRHFDLTVSIDRQRRSVATNGFWFWKMFNAQSLERNRELKILYMWIVL